MRRKFPLRGESRLRWGLLWGSLDSADCDGFYTAARGLMYNPAVDQAFGFNDEAHSRYGRSNFGDACLVAERVLEADHGTRFVQIVSNGWDHHQDTYAAGVGNRLPVRGRQLDACRPRPGGITTSSTFQYLMESALRAGN